MEKFIVYVYRNPNKILLPKDKAIINLDKEKSLFMGVIQNICGLGNKSEIKKKYNFSSYSFKQNEIWSLLSNRNKYKLSIVTVKFKIELEEEDYENFQDYLKGAVTQIDIRSELETYTEIQEVDFIYKSIKYSINSAGVISVVTILENLEKEILVPPILSLMGINYSSKQRRFI